MADLKATKEDIIQAIGRGMDAAIDGLRHEGERLVEGVRRSAEILEAPPSIASADAACVIDGINVYGGATQLALNMGGYGGHANFVRSPARGVYRAVVLLVRTGDLP